MNAISSATRFSAVSRLAQGLESDSVQRAEVKGTQAPIEQVSLSASTLGGARGAAPGEVAPPATPGAGAVAARDGIVGAASAVASTVVTNVSGLPTLAAAGPSPAASVQARPWRGDLIYFAMTDRFQDGDTTNNFGVNKADINRFHGGDLQGLIDKLDYIKNDVGATAIWLTPPMANQDTFVNTDGYHGYWPVDYFSGDKHLGDMAKFKEFVDKAHDKGLKVLLDIPLNHVAWDHPMWKKEGEQPGSPKYGWFHHNGDVKDWNDPWQAENCSIFGLPDLAQENPEVADYLIKVAKFWADTGVDGFRLDAVKNVPLSFWQRFDKELHDYKGKDFLLIGEYFDGDPSKYRKLQDADMTAVDYPLHYTMKDVFARDGSMKQLAGRLAECANAYPHPEMMGAFLDNHDTQRFLTEADGNKQRLKLGLAFVTTINRIPILYYGTEVGLQSDRNGWAESSRKDMPFGSDPDLTSYTGRLGAIRNQSIALREGNLLEMWQDDQVFAFDRMHAEGEAVVVLNNSWDQQARDIPLRAESRLKNGTVLKEQLTGELVTVKDGRIHAQLQPKGAGIYLPQ